MAFTQKLSRYLTLRSRRGEFSGAVLVRRGDETLFARAFGLANRTWGIRNQVNTRFRIASVGKLFTAVAVLQLVESGQLSLETRLAEFKFPAGVPEGVTIRHLLTMTSGMADYYDESRDESVVWAEMIRKWPIFTLKDNHDYLQMVLSLAPLEPVGSKFRYNNGSFVLLGEVIEQLYGQKYEEVIRSQVFARAQMLDTDFLLLDEVYPEIAEGYIPLRGEHEHVTGWQKNSYLTTPAPAADGGETSTLEDLCSFVRALRSGRLLGAEMTAAMLTPRVGEEEVTPGVKWMYGFGNSFLVDAGGRILRWGHAGEEGGVSCRLYYYPRQDLDVVVMGNQSSCAGAAGLFIHELIQQGGVL